MLTLETASGSGRGIRASSGKPVNGTMQSVKALYKVAIVSKKKKHVIH